MKAKKIAAEKLLGVQAIQNSKPDKIASTMPEEVLMDCIFLKIKHSSANSVKIIWNNWGFPW
jgi:hypothetical protein